MRVFIIADYYRHLFHSQDPSLFYQELARYINTMCASQKENTYIFQCLFFTPEEYEVYKKNFNNMSNSVVNKKANLKLVE